jgi:predicted Zn-dependent peptidase
MTHPRFDDIEAERALVEAEISGELDTSGEDADIGALSRARIWAGHPLGRRIVGSLDISPSWTAADVRRHHRRHYVGLNMVLAVTGCVNADQVEAAVRAAFADLKPGARTPSGRPPKFCGSPLVTIPRDDHEVTLQLTFEALPDGHPDFAALSLLTNLLDDGMGTRLHRALSEKSGLVYTFSSGLDCYADCGLYDIELQVPTARVQAALAATCEVLYDVAHGAVGEAELRAMQERTLCAIELGQDSAEDVAQEAAVDALFGRPGPKAYETALRRATPEDIRRLAHKMFMASRYQVTVLTPPSGIELDQLASAIPAMRKRGGSATPMQVSRRRTPRRLVR